MLHKPHPRLWSPLDVRTHWYLYIDRVTTLVIHIVHITTLLRINDDNDLYATGARQNLQHKATDCRQEGQAKQHSTRPPRVPYAVRRVRSTSRAPAWSTYEFHHAVTSLVPLKRLKGHNTCLCFLMALLLPRSPRPRQGSPCSFTTTYRKRLIRI